MAENSGNYGRETKEDAFTARFVSNGSPHLHEINADMLWFRIEQRIRRGAALDMWNSLSVYCEQERDGTLLVRVVIFNPDWDGPLQIAAIRSRPHDVTSLVALGCNLDHVAT